jgi:hypothetical protein
VVATLLWNVSCGEGAKRWHVEKVEKSHWLSMCISHYGLPHPCRTLVALQGLQSAQMTLFAKEGVAHCLECSNRETLFATHGTMQVISRPCEALKV